MVGGKDMSKYRAKYIITSERADRRNDERRNEFCTDRILNVGDTFELDGLMWTVDEIVYDRDRGIGV